MKKTLNTISFVLVALALIVGASLFSSVETEAAKKGGTCSRSCGFVITKAGYTYSVTGTARYTCSRSWPSWGCALLQAEATDRISPGALSGSWGLSCGNVHSYSGYIIGVPTPPPSCGSADGTTVSSAPSTGLCSAGTPSSVTDNGGTYSWTCSGNGTASCIATKADCPSGQKKCDGQCVAEGTSCGGGGGDDEEDEDTDDLCPAGQKTCANQCVREESECYEDDLLANFSLVPDIVKEGTNERCIAEWVAQDVDGDASTVVTCTINGDQAPQFTEVGAGVDLLPGTYTLSCTDGLTSQSTTTRCRAIPNFEEF